jgi:hypothetical protein
MLYVVFLVVETFLWISYHTAVFYLLEVPVPEHETVMDATSTIPDDASTRQEAENYELEPTQKMLQDDTTQSKWNEIVLHSAKSQQALRPHSSSPPPWITPHRGSLGLDNAFGGK